MTEPISGPELAAYLNARNTGRRYTETERIKCGSIKAVFYHREYDRPGGKQIGSWTSAGNQYADQDIGLLIVALAERGHDAVAQRMNAESAGE